MRSAAPVIVIAVAVGLAVFAGMGVFMYRSCSQLADLDEAGGVKFASDMPPYASALMVKRGHIGPGEKAVAFYDTTLSLDGSDFFLLTDRRVLHDAGGRAHAIALDRIASVEHRDGGIEGDVILVRSKDSDYLKITIAAFNDGALFLDALRSEWKQHGGGDVEKKPAEAE